VRIAEGTSAARSLSSGPGGRCPRVAILAVGSSSGEIGGAERFYVGLRDAMVRAGAEAEIVCVVSDESDFEAVKQSYLRFYDFNLAVFDGVISTKAPGYIVRHRNHICYLQHTMRVFYDMFDAEFPWANETLREQRQLVQMLDTVALKPPHTRRLFVISHEVQQRLRAFNGLESEVLYQASTLSGFRTGEYRYLFLPGRLHRWKRVDLVIQAMRHVRSPVQLLICGTGEDAAHFQQMAAGDSRILFLGRVSDLALLDLYSNALSVAFVPQNEDFGLVMLEAFLSGKPVITCQDSGEPARLVQDRRSGYVCPPEPEVIADRIDRLARNPERAAEMGRYGMESIRHLSWDRVGETLYAALGF